MIKNFVKNIMVITAFLVAIILISSSSISIPLKIRPKTEKIDLFEVDEVSSGLAPPRKQIPVPSEMKSINSEQVSIGQDGYLMYMEHTVSGGGAEHFSIDTENPDEIYEEIRDSEAGDFLSGGTFGCDEIWYGVQYSDGVLWGMDIYSEDMWCIGGGGDGLNGLAWDPIYNRLYGVGSVVYDDTIYEIDPDTGEQEELFMLDYSGGIMAGMAFDMGGVLYGWDLVADSLWIIDIETETVEEVGPLGVDLNYAQDGDFHRESDQLYLTAYTTTGQLYLCDKVTGECELIDQLPNNWECTASCFGNCCFIIEHDVGVKSIVSPAQSGYAVPDMDMELLVKNFGNNTETFDAQMEIYNQTNQSGSILMEEDFSGTFPPEGWEADGWTQSNTSCSSDPPAACLFPYNQVLPFIGGNITSKAVDASEYKRCRLNFVFCANMLYPQYCSFYIKFRRNESSPWKAITPWDNPLGEQMEGDLYEIDICSFNNSEGCGEALQIQWEYIGYYYYYNYFCLDTIILEGINYSIEYAELVKDITLDSGESKEIEFPSWTPSYWQDPEYENTWVDYPIHAFTIMEGDQNPRNNRKGKNIDLYFPWMHDLELTSVYPCEDGPGKIYPVEATITNVGQYAKCCIPININISDFVSEYSDNACQGEYLEPGETRIFEFDDWTPDFLQYETTGSTDHTVQAEITKVGDQNPDNDIVSEDFTLDYWHDVKIFDISSPEIFSRPHNNEYWYHYDDGTTVDSFGLTQGGTFEYAIRLTPDEIGIYGEFDCTITKIKRQHSWNNSFDMTGKIKIYKEGTSTHPGDLITEESFTCYDADWHEIVLSESVKITGTGDIWISCEVTHEAGQFPAAMDPLGPVYEKSDWLYINSEWIEAYEYGIYTDWNLRVGLDLIGPPQPHACIKPGIQDINITVTNFGTFPEMDLTCYTEIYEYITDPENGTFVYKDTITGIDLEEPVGGFKYLEFEDYNFSMEGIYALFSKMPDVNDDYPRNNEVSVSVHVDNTSPISDYPPILDPPVPDGDNGWYVSDVYVTLKATDPVSNGVSSGIIEIKYRVNGGPIESIPGSEGTFYLTQEDDGDDVLVEYWAIDQVGNEETQHHTFTIDMDHSCPDIDLIYEITGGNPIMGWTVLCQAIATDEISGMDRVEFYLNYVLQETVMGSGPMFEWEFIYHGGLYLIVTAEGFDIAGNMASDEIDHIKNFYNQNTQQQTQIRTSSYFMQNPLQRLFVIPEEGYR